MKNIKYADTVIIQLSVRDGGENMLDIKNGEGKTVLTLNDEGEQESIDEEYFNKINEENETNYRVKENGEIVNIEEEENDNN